MKLTNRCAQATRAAADRNENVEAVTGLWFKATAAHRFAWLIQPGDLVQIRPIPEERPAHERCHYLMRSATGVERIVYVTSNGRGRVSAMGYLNAFRSVDYRAMHGAEFYRIIGWALPVGRVAAGTGLAEEFLTLGHSLAT